MKTCWSPILKKTYQTEKAARRAEARSAKAIAKRLAVAITEPALPDWGLKRNIHYSPWEPA